MKILLLIPSWQRREVTKVCFSGILRLQDEAKAAGFELIPFIIHSHDADRRLAVGFGFPGIRAKNKPLGNKLNRGLSAAFKMEWHYLMQLGSDDLLAKGFFAPGGWKGKDSVFWHLENLTPFFGCNELCIIDTSVRLAKYANVLSPFGAGRFIRRDVVETTVRKKGYLWEPDRNSGLDFSSERMIGQCFPLREVRIMPIHNHGYPMVVDIKSETNIHAFDDIPGKPLTKSQQQWMWEVFPELTELRYNAIL